MLDVANEDGETAFSIARRSGNYEEFEVMHLLFAAGATVREDEFQMDPHVLASACANGNDALVQALLQAGAPVDVPCPISKETPLTAAAAAGLAGAGLAAGWGAGLAESLTGAGLVAGCWFDSRQS